MLTIEEKPRDGARILSLEGRLDAAVRGANETVMDALRVTGFDGILNLD